MWVHRKSRTVNEGLENKPKTAGICANEWISYVMAKPHKPTNAECCNTSKRKNMTY
jgi:hypothetical protein